MLDYAKLFRIAHDLISTDSRQNVSGLDMLGGIIGADITGPVLDYFQATKLAIKAGKTIIDGIKTRDVMVNTVISQYHRRLHDEEF